MRLGLLQMQRLRRLFNGRSSETTSKKKRRKLSGKKESNLKNSRNFFGRRSRKCSGNLRSLTNLMTFWSATLLFKNFEPACWRKQKIKLGPAKESSIRSRFQIFSD